jgi:ribosome modulation factor
MGATVQSILHKHFHHFAASHRLPIEQLAAAQRMRDCRTAALGGHVVGCPHGHVARIVYNSCRHRSCPLCSLLDRERWLDGWKERMLNCPHHHVIVTIPHFLLPLWRYNKRAVANALFWAASGALLELLGDAAYLGAVPGLLAALHTWGQALLVHVHLHVVVTAGGLTRAGGWENAKKSCLLPRKVLMIKIRGKFRSRLLRLLKKGELTLPPDTTAAYWLGQLNKAGRVDWNVKICERYRNGRTVATYLARYLKGGPLPPSRLLSCEQGTVRFRYRDNRDREASGKGKRKVANLPVDQFLGRLLEHVPEPNFQTVRGYGLYAGCKRAALDTARACLGQAAVELPEKPLSWQGFCKRLGHEEKASCPVCGVRLELLSRFERGRAPPSLKRWLSRAEERKAA